MKYFYEAPTALLETNRPRTTHHATTMPDNPALSMVVVEGWPDHATQDEWEVLPGVIEHPIWTWNDPAAPSIQSGLASLAPISVVDAAPPTFGELMQELRKTWPGARH